MSNAQSSPVSRVSTAYLAYLGAITALVGPASPFVAIFSSAVPSFACQSSTLAAFTPLAALVVIAVVLFVRSYLFSFLFPRVPKDTGPSPHAVIAVTGSIAISIILLAGYIYVLEQTRDALTRAQGPGNWLKVADCHTIPAWGLLVLYVVAFACLQIALLLMFLREYFQHVVIRKSDRELILGPAAAKSLQSRGD